MSFSKIGAATSVGRVRTNNEDAFFTDARLGVLAVADGMGGHAAGEHASHLAIAAVHTLCASPRHYGKLIFAERDENAEKGIRHFFHRTHELILSGAARHPERAGMGTTLTLVVVEGGRLRLGHVGDSAAFLVRPSRGILPLTMPHHSDCGLSSCLGVNQDSMRIVDAAHHDVVVGDLVLLCTDGLTHYADATRIGRRVLRMAGADSQEIADGLIALALAEGGQDNATVVVGLVM